MKFECSGPETKKRKIEGLCWCFFALWIQSKLAKLFEFVQFLVNGEIEASKKSIKHSNIKCDPEPTTFTAIKEHPPVKTVSQV